MLRSESEYFCLVYSASSWSRRTEFTLDVQASEFLCPRNGKDDARIVRRALHADQDDNPGFIKAGGAVEHGLTIVDMTFTALAVVEPAPLVVGRTFHLNLPGLTILGRKQIGVRRRSFLIEIADPKATGFQLGCADVFGNPSDIVTMDLTSPIHPRRHHITLGRSVQMVFLRSPRSIEVVDDQSLLRVSSCASHGHMVA
jgi:hypothetical protein